MDNKYTLTIKGLIAQLRFAASSVNAYCEKLPTDIFGKCNLPIDTANEEFYALSSVLSATADSVAELANELWAASLEASEDESFQKLRAIAEIAVGSAEMFEDISVAIYSHIRFGSVKAEIDVPALRRDAAGFLIKLREAVRSISES